MAFPGGKREASDRDDRAAAARETEEEIGHSGLEISHLNDLLAGYIYIYMCVCLI